MHTSRRAILATALTSAAPAVTSGGEIASHDIAARLAALSETANGALMRGDIARYSELITFTDDFTFMSPFGGAPKRGPLNDAQMTAMGRFFRDGVLKMDLIEAYVTEGIAVLAVVEHNHVAVGGLPAQDWTLRVTLVYRRYGAEWRLAHRHADPLPAELDLAGAAALARQTMR